MSRLQKKCIVWSLAAHVILLLVLALTPALSEPKVDPVDQIYVIDFVPDRVVDQALFVPPPASPVEKVPEPVPEPVAAKPPPEPVKEPDPQPKKVEDPKPTPVKPIQKPPVKPVKEPWKANKTVEVNITPVKVKNQPKVNVRPKTSTADFDKAINKVNSTLSSKTSLSYSSPSSDSSAADYASEVVRRYKSAWIPPSGANPAAGTTEIRVVISKSGEVTSARIVKGSGIAAVDQSVRNALDRVKVVMPFPAGSKDNERTFNINLILETN